MASDGGEAVGRHPVTISTHEERAMPRKPSTASTTESAPAAPVTPDTVTTPRSEPVETPQTEPVETRADDEGNVPAEPVAPSPGDADYEPFVPRYEPEPEDGWAIGQIAPRDRFGILDPATGNVHPTGRKGLDSIPEGTYGTIIIRKGDRVTAGMRRAVGLDA